MTSVSTRRGLIRKLLSAEVIASQAELVERLRTAGHPVTQTTVSRDLEAIGAVKESNGGNTRYRIATDPPLDSASRSLARTVRDFVEEISASGNLTILRTPPGAAHLVASALDGAGVDGLLGTVAGDDTVFAAAAEGIGGAALAERLEQMGASA